MCLGRKGPEVMDFSGVGGSVFRVRSLEAEWVKAPTSIVARDLGFASLRVKRREGLMLCGIQACCARTALLRYEREAITKKFPGAAM